MKTKSGLFWICLLGMLLPAGLRAQFLSATNNGAFVITGYTGSGGSVTIPGVSNGLPVVIGDYAFSYQSTLTNLTIMDGVLDIGSSAFDSCVNLTAVAIPDTVTNLGDWAFAYSSLTNVTIPGGIGNIGSYAFWNCNELTNVTILDGVTNIDSWAFPNCFGLNTVTLPASLQTIAVFVFESCPALMNVYCLGNAPTVVTTPFSGSNTVFQGDPGTLYYLPDATGWTNTFGGLPTAVWTPRVQTGGASLGVTTNQFGFNLIWAAGQTVIVEACTNLAHPIWQPLQTNTLTSGTAYFSDPQWTNYPARFYRLRSQ